MTSIYLLITAYASTASSVLLTLRIFDPSKNFYSSFMGEALIIGIWFFAQLLIFCWIIMHFLPSIAF